MSLPMDPAECPWTPEGEELRSDREARYIQYLDLLAEDEDYELRCMMSTELADHMLPLTQQQQQPC